jgi:putative GTP pyrophosphokinase
LLSKNQIDKLGDQLREGRIDAEVLRKLEAVRAEYAGAYLRVEHILTEVLGYKVTGRPSKSTVAVIEKLKRESARLSQIQDIAGCRIVAENVRVQDDICHAATVMLGDVSTIDRRLKPTNGYRAVHLIARYDGRPVEIQVRTQLQHAWAEISEKISDAYGQGIKYGQGESWAVEFLDELSSLTARMEAVDTKLVDFKRRSEFLADEAARKKKAPRKIVEELKLDRRLLLYRIREHFRKLRDK